MIQPRSQKRKAAALVINNYTSSVAKCMCTVQAMNFFLVCNEMKYINEKCQNNFACVEPFSV